ncbi:MAG TPA: MFS transporter [Galbitalea sp.]|jgi:predicted MFS family arabinose efflux permease|nr:MFS transporter [Galbitalea sp.]
MASARPPARNRGAVPYFALITLAVAVFISVTLEMLPTGLLPQMSAGLGVTESQIGFTVSIFAFTVVVTSAPISILMRRVPRHALLIAVLVVLAASALVSALSINYTMLVVSRIIGGIAHGVFWSVVGAYAAYLVPKEHLGRAVSIVLGGGSLAFVLGVPLGTALGAAFGWRLSFGVVAGLALVGAIFLFRFVPRVDHLAAGGVITTPTGSIRLASREQLAEPPRRDHSVTAVVFVCLITAVTMIGQYTFYTFIAPYLLGPVGLSESELSPALFAYGAAGAISLVLVALWLGRRPRLWLLASLLFLAAAILALALAPAITPLAIGAFFLWGLAMGNLPPLLQTRLLHAAPARIRDTASAFYTSAFNVGIGGGALVGSLVLAGVGLSALPWVFIGILVLALVLTVVSDLLLRPRAA